MGSFKYYDSDRLSWLPDEVIHTILSFLDMKQVVQMSLVSKRWRYLWKSLSTLNIDFRLWMDTDVDNRRSFLRFVRQVLLLRNTSFNIHEFRLVCSEKSIARRMNKLIKSVVRKNYVQELYLEGIHKMVDSTLVTFNQVKSLKLISVKMDDEENGELKLIFPEVEDLVLENCSIDIDFFTINAPRLKYLMIENESTNLGELELHVPNLSLLHFAGEMFPDYSLKNLSSLVTAHIDIDTEYLGWGAEEAELFATGLENLLKGLCNAKTLTLSACAFQTCRKLPKLLKTDDISFPNLKYLKVTNLYSNGHIHALAKLFQKFSNVETIILEGIEAYGQENERKHWGKQLALQCSFPELKSLEFQDLGGYANELKFLHFLIKSAPALEKITIITAKAVSDDKVKKFAEFRKVLQSLPRVSSRITILFRINNRT